MPASTSDNAGVVVKKRRSFFSSNLPLPPIVPAPSTSRQPIVPRAQVLAALSAPEEAALYAPRPRREQKPKEVEATAPNPEQASASRARSTRQPPPVTSSPPPSGRSLRQRTSTKSLKEPDSGASSPLLRSPSRNNATKRKIPTSKPASVPTRKGKEKTASKDENAQSINERLSLMMMQSMRATIGGREKPYERVPVYKERASKKRKQAKLARRAALRTAKRPSTLVSLTARQRAKQRAKEKEQAEGSESEEVEEEDEQELEKEEPESTPKKAPAGKKYMTSGFYCQDANAQSPFKLVNKVLGEGSSRKNKSSQKPAPSNAKRAGLSFPPLPYDHGYDHFFGKEHDFLLPYNIHKEATHGALNDKKKPAPYQKIRGNRSRSTAERAICKCDPAGDCSDDCINRIMNYLCGRDCPCGDKCTNRSLTKRVVIETKVKYTGSRGFGLFAMQDIKEGDFVTDYRGEVISLEAFQERLKSEYAGQRNFYALAYDQDEVIDAGLRGNDARFINHGCDPNLEVRKMQTLGDGFEEFEIGMWALKDIKQGDELFYNYNFDWFGKAKDELTAECRCGAPNCIGYLGKRNDRSAIAIEVEAKKAAEAARAKAKGRKGGKAARKLAKRLKMKTSNAVDRAKTAEQVPTPAAEVEESGATGGKGKNVIYHLDGGDEHHEIEKPTPLHGGAEDEASESDWIDVSVVVDLPELPIVGNPPATENIEVSTAAAAPSAPTEDPIIASPMPSPPRAIKVESPGQRASRSQSPANRAHPGPVPRSSLIFSMDPEPDDEQIPSSPLRERIPTPEPVSKRNEGNDHQNNISASSTSISAGPGAGTDSSAVSATGSTPSTSEEEAQRRAEAAAAKRKSGWASWLRKIASEKQRTIEEWHEERMKRRRGIAWMNMMIAEFGVAPSPTPLSTEAYSDGRKPAGSVGSFANTLAAQGHGPGPAGVRNLGGPKNMYRMDNWKKTKEEQMRYASMRPGSMTPAPQTPSQSTPASAILPGSAPAAPRSSQQVIPPAPSSVPSKRPVEVGHNDQPLGVSSKKGKTEAVSTAALASLNDDREKSLTGASGVASSGYHGLPPPSRHLKSYPQPMQSTDPDVRAFGYRASPADGLPFNPPPGYPGQRTPQQAVGSINQPPARPAFGSWSSPVSPFGHATQAQTSRPLNGLSSIQARSVPPGQPQAQTRPAQISVQATPYIASQRSPLNASSAPQRSFPEMKSASARSPPSQRSDPAGPARQQTSVQSQASQQYQPPRRVYWNVAATPASWSYQGGTHIFGPHRPSAPANPAFKAPSASPAVNTAPRTPAETTSATGTPKEQAGALMASSAPRAQTAASQANAPLRVQAVASTPNTAIRPQSSVSIQRPVPIAPRPAAPSADRQAAVARPAATYPQPTIAHAEPAPSDRTPVSIATPIPAPTSSSSAAAATVTSNASVPAAPGAPEKPIPDATETSSPVSRGLKKKDAIQKRNGAPMGWVYTYEPINSTATRMGEVIIEDLPRSARRSRQSTVKVEPINVD